MVEPDEIKAFLEDLSKKYGVPVKFTEEKIFAHYLPKERAVEVNPELLAMESTKIVEAGLDWRPRLEFIYKHEVEHMKIDDWAVSNLIEPVCCYTFFLDEWEAIASTPMDYYINMVVLRDEFECVRPHYRVVALEVMESVRVRYVKEGITGVYYERPYRFSTLCALSLHKIYRTLTWKEIRTCCGSEEVSLIRRIMRVAKFCDSLERIRPCIADMCHIYWDYFIRRYVTRYIPFIPRRPRMGCWPYSYEKWREMKMKGGR